MHALDKQAHRGVVMTMSANQDNSCSPTHTHHPPRPTNTAHTMLRALARPVQRGLQRGQGAAAAKVRSGENGESKRKGKTAMRCSGHDPARNHTHTILAHPHVHPRPTTAAAAEQEDVGPGGEELLR